MLSPVSPLPFPTTMITILLTPCHFCYFVKGHWWSPNMQILSSLQCYLTSYLSGNFSLSQLLKHCSFPVLFWPSEHSFWVTTIGCFIADLSLMSLFSIAHAWLSFHCTCCFQVSSIHSHGIYEHLCSSVPKALLEFWSLTVYPRFHDT